MPCEPPEREKIAVLMPTSCRRDRQRAAGIAGIDRGVGLDEELVVGDADLVRASAETMPCVTVWPTPNGLPMRQHQVADLERVGIAEIERRRISRGCP